MKRFVERAQPLTIALLGLFVGLLPAEAAAEQKAMTFEHTISKSVRLDYLLHLPPGYRESDESFPLILFLHGAGERGSDLQRLKKHGPPKLLAQGKRIPAIVVSPQCPADSWWTEYLDTLVALLDDIEASHRVDPSQIYLTGLSMGGYGTWALATRQPERFAAAAPICGDGSVIPARRLTRMPIWAFHGEVDAVVPVDESRRLVRAIEAQGGKLVKLTVYSGVGHDSWTAAYDDPDLWQWLFAQRLPEEGRPVEGSR